MRRIPKNSPNKQNQNIRRGNSHANFTLTHTLTIAEINHVSARSHKPKYHSSKPVRILLPDYFNVPKFVDDELVNKLSLNSQQILLKKMRSELEVRRKLKDLQILAQGMRRAKNIKQESRYYFTEGVIFHNYGMFQASVDAFEKFLKMVLFIKDEKSVQLALNAIGTQLMYAKQPAKAIEYHVKQRDFGERTDKFISRVNCGMCYELQGRNDQALIEYRIAETVLAMDPQQNRKQLLHKLLNRIQSKIQKQ